MSRRNGEGLVSVYIRGTLQLIMKCECMRAAPVSNFLQRLWSGDPIRVTEHWGVQCGLGKRWVPSWHCVRITFF
jgi:hypothetical protein